MPLNFTLQYNDRINDILDSAGDVAETVVTGPMYFVPSLLPGYRIPAPGLLPKEAGLAMRGFAGYLDTDGKLKTEPGGEEGVRLWANDPNWDMPRLQYTAHAKLTDLIGNEVPWIPIPFDAPKEDVVVQLAAEMPKPRHKFGRGRPGLGLARDGATIDNQGNLVLMREDGYPLGTVTVPELSDSLDEASAQTIAFVTTFGR